jgi:hypothetical protein
MKKKQPRGAETLIAVELDRRRPEATCDHQPDIVCGDCCPCGGHDTEGEKDDKDDPLPQCGTCGTEGGLHVSGCPRQKPTANQEAYWYWRNKAERAEAGLSELLGVARVVAGEPCRTPRPHGPCRPGKSLCTPCEARIAVARVEGK